MRRKKAIRVSLAARIERTKPEGRKSRDEGQTSLRFPFPFLQLRFIQSSTLAGKPTSVCDVVASVSSPNTQHPDKYEIPSTKHGGSLPLSLSRGRKEGRSRATPVVALHSRRREGKNPLVYQESSGRNGDRGGKREREREGRKESRLLVSDFAFASRAIDRRNIYFDSRFVSFNSSPSCIWRI